ncbi:MAG: beta-phosphoglucomutase [Verrucomicrobia bacterium]|nr:beta-phosphoglucomutase [Verrucomicrobiota bacterium]
MIRAVIFDLDGVLVSTDEFHYQAWQMLARAEGIPFSREDNERLKGVSRMESLELILERSPKTFPEEAKLAMAERKNTHYRELLKKLSPTDILPGVREFLATLRSRGIRAAIGSSSKNAVPILEAIGLAKAFEAVADGTRIRKSKPDPEVFLLAAGMMATPPEHCLVVEDAEAGVEAGLAAGMKVLAVGSASTLPRATYGARNLSEADPALVLA